MLNMQTRPQAGICSHCIVLNHQQRQTTVTPPTEAFRQILRATCLRAEAEGVAGEPGPREVGQPVLRPAPGRVEAPVHEHQRRAAPPRRRRGLRDDLEVEAARQAVEAAGLALLERVGARGAEEGPRCPPPHPRRPRRRRAGEERRSGEGGGGHGWPLDNGDGDGCECESVTARGAFR
jgi:hypothetical protein